MAGTLNIDGFGWSLLKYSTSQLENLPKEAEDDRRQSERETFRRYHLNIRSWIESHGGTVWSTIGDCTIAHKFKTIDEAVAAAMTIQRRLTDFNLEENQLSTPLFVRIGVSNGDLPDVPPHQRGEASDPALDESGHLQKTCPPGRIRISRKVFENLRYSQHDFRPGLSADSKPLSAGSMVWLERMLTREIIEVASVMTPRQARSYPPLVVTGPDVVRIGFEGTLADVRKTLGHSVVILGESRPEHGSGPVSHTAASSSAVGIIEVFATLQSSPGGVAGIDEWSDTVDLATQKDIIVVGGPAVNLFAFAINRVMNAGFHEAAGEPMRIRIRESDRWNYFPPSLGHDDLPNQHFGFLFYHINPMSPSHRMLWVAGITGMGTQAAACLLRDLVDSPTRALNQINEPRSNVIVVKPKLESGYSSNQYQSIWRVGDYEIVWAGRVV